MYKIKLTNKEVQNFFKALIWQLNSCSHTSLLCMTTVVEALANPMQVVIYTNFNPCLAFSNGFARDHRR